jgi:hypothetical protein
VLATIPFVRMAKDAGASVSGHRAKQVPPAINAEQQPVK